MTRPNRTVEHWETVTVTALPAGWRNVYRHDDGTVTTDACPGILVQEHRVDVACWDVLLGDGRFRVDTRKHTCDPPYETRTIYAGSAECGYLEPVNDVGNYAGTVAPDEDPSVYASATAA